VTVILQAGSFTGFDRLHTAYNEAAMRRSPIIIFVLLLAWLCPAVASGAAPAGLRVLETRHYRIHTDVAPEFAEELAARMDAMHGEYSRRLSDFTLPAGMPKFEIYIFNRQADYMRFTGNRFPNTGGVFMPGRNLLAAFLEGQGRDALRRTLQHEAFHQFAHVAIRPDMPIWLNEGLAQLFEEGLWTGAGFQIGQVPPRRVRQLQNDIQGRRLVDFPKLLAMSHQQWGENLTADADQGAIHYNQVWAMVHFLVFAEDNRGRPRYRQALIDMLKLINQGHGGEQAFNKVFAGNVEGFQARFSEWAMQLKPTAEATVIEHQDVLADFLKAMTGEGMTFNNFEEFKAAVIRGRYRMNYTRGQIRWQTDPNPTRYFADLDGRPFQPADLYFEPNPGGPLPDIICRITPHTVLRTRFHPTSTGLEHEVLIQPLEQRPVRRR
jgi:hypothetical protein